MKKFLITLMLASLPLQVSASYMDTQLKDTKNNVKYNTVNKYKRSYQNLNLNIRKINDLKDPKLIQLKTYPEISEKDFQTKLAKDEETYKKVKGKVKAYNEVEYYNVYRIAERIIRANNLDYANWRIAVRKTFDKVNAHTGDGNFICIYTALYDSLTTNDDALAFVIAHEMSHLILGHGQRKMDAVYNLNAVEHYTLYKSSRTMEYMADAEAMILLYKAGYSPERAMDALYMLDAIPNINSVFYSSTHPHTAKRIESAIENISVLDPNWVAAGRANIYNSEVLVGKKSSDRVSVIIPKSDVKKDFYQPETYEQRLTRVAYMNYLNGNMKNASKYFAKLANTTGRYEHYLYESYANQYMYKFTNKKKYLKKSEDAVNSAMKLNPNNEYVKKQYSELGELSAL